MSDAHTGNIHGSNAAGFRGTAMARFASPLGPMTPSKATEEWNPLGAFGRLVGSQTARAAGTTTEASDHTKGAFNLGPHNGLEERLDGPEEELLYEAPLPFR